MASDGQRGVALGRARDLAASSRTQPFVPRAASAQSRRAGYVKILTKLKKQLRQLFFQAVAAHFFPSNPPHNNTHVYLYCTHCTPPTHCAWAAPVWL